MPRTTVCNLVQIRKMKPKHSSSPSLPANRFYNWFAPTKVLSQPFWAQLAVRSRQTPKLGALAD